MPLHLLPRSIYQTRAMLLGMMFNDEHHVLHGGGVVLDADTYENLFAGIEVDVGKFDEAFAALNRRKSQMIGWEYPPEETDANT